MTYKLWIGNLQTQTDNGVLVPSLPPSGYVKARQRLQLTSVLQKLYFKEYFSKQTILKHKLAQAAAAVESSNEH